MTTQLEQDLTGPNGALTEANKTISDGKDKLKTSIDEMIREVSTDFLYDKIASDAYYNLSVPFYDGL